MELNKIYLGDCLKTLKTFPSNSIDAVCCDPPYGLSFMGKKWDYDVPSQEIWEECLRVLKPGGYLLAFAGTRTQHRMAVRIEDAGFEIRDMIAWVYGSGFPKSRNIGKDIEKINVGGLKNLKQIGTKKGIKCETGTKGYSYSKEYVAGKCMGGKQVSGDIPVYEINNEWEGWGTALKPALEPITVARKPISEKTVAENVLKWGTGGINIDACRVEFGGETDKRVGTDEVRGEKEGLNSKSIFGCTEKGVQMYKDNGRFPANFLHDGSDEVVDLFPNSKSTGGVKPIEQFKGNSEFNASIKGANPYYNFNDSGSAARFFYCAKASKSERNAGCEELEEKTAGERTGRKDGSAGINAYAGATGASRNFHPTVKPIKLMEYLVKLVSRENAIVLDPFTGSGSTGVACKNLNRQFIGCELSPEYCEIIKARTGFEVIKVDGEVEKEIKEVVKEVKQEVKKGLSKCCNAKIKKGYCEMCCEKVE